MRLFAKIAAIASIAASFCGCKDINWTDVNLSSVDKAPTTYAVVVGMEKSAFAGDCPGAKLDSSRMFKLLSGYTDNIVLLQDGQATRAAITDAMKNAVSKADLFIFYYSGHGGSQRFYDTGAEEVDGTDEFLCPYDSYIRDNEIWSIISKAKGRVVLCIDACHSQTMFRQPFRMRNVSLSATHTATGNISMQCWSGCPDNTYSYGSITGGMFTNTLLKYFNTSLSYDALWDKIDTDRGLQNSQMVQRTKMGSDFGSTRIFK